MVETTLLLNGAGVPGMEWDQYFKFEMIIMKRTG